MHVVNQHSQSTFLYNCSLMLNYLKKKHIVEKCIISFHEIRKEMYIKIDLCNFEMLCLFIFVMLNKNM